ncbi:MFS transporter [Arthrobacter sp. PGP41]|uniref:MFS transporter n=1 Tax=unclassified Arthrobacter TaxID=235627 RepID=UPI000CDC5088|nr:MULTISPECIES: MFS transporter [unclassified Arthrobacter]AUZ34664.1 MFS transporter [Arthrobacter sp. PGP41]MDT0196623.1 MFS transporter [Arthrobacter sp. AB6]
MISRQESRRWLWMLIASAVLCQIALNLARPLISYKVLALGGDAATVGLIAAAYALLPVVIALWLGRMSDKSPSLRGIIVAGTALLAAGPFLLSGAPSLLLIAVASAVLGLGHLCFTIAGQSAIARFLPYNQMDAAFGWFTAAFALGQLVGPLLAGLLMGAAQGVPAAVRLADANTALMFAGAICILGVPAAFATSVKQPKKKPTAKATSPDAAPASVASLLATPTVKANMAASLALLATTDILVAFLPLLGEESGVPPLMVGVLLAVRAGASISSRLLLPVLLSRWSRPALVTSSLAGAAIPLALLPSVFETPILAGVLLAIAGFFLGLGQPLTMTLISQAVPPAARGAALALRLLGNRLGQVTLPLAAGLLVAPAGPGGSVWMSSAILMAACIRRPRK